jgi:hypothetical protein
MRMLSPFMLVLCLLGCEKPKVVNTSPNIVPVTVAVATTKTVPVQGEGHR